MTPVLNKTQQERILTPAILRLMEVLAAGGGEARVVGGALRDIILARPIGDIDLAVNISPEQVMLLLEQAGIRTIPTGLAHGTITAVVEHIGYEITSLRRDVATDGRHAQITYTQDWRTDAARRDFTFNALYLDIAGHLYDYFGGCDDAIKGRVRFIGDASTRIREDYLRILRFFRFIAWFEQGDPDQQALAACQDLADKLLELSAERIAREILKLLMAPNPLPAWQLMHTNGALAYVAPQAIDFTHLQNLLVTETTLKEPASGLLRLAALLPAERDVAIQLAQRLKFSTKDSEKITTLATLPNQLTHPNTPQTLRGFLYTYGTENTRAALLLKGVTDTSIFSQITTWQKPIFPLRGEDLVRCGVAAGPRIGAILRASEEWWVAGDFSADHAACLAFAEEYGKDH